MEEKNICFIEPDIYFTKLMFILKNINLELKSALRTKYLFYQSLLYSRGSQDEVMEEVEDLLEAESIISGDRMPR